MAVEERDDAVVEEIGGGNRRLAIIELLDFRRADAHAGRIERRIGAAIDDHAAVLRPFGEIAMRPDSKRPPN